MNLTEDQILTLAPDESSKKAGKDLANPSKWVTKGFSQEAIWGECQGSGSKPYQTGIDLSNIAFKCSCPSRKFPCKHGIALGLLAARQPELLQASAPPDWVMEWVQKRAQKEEKKVEPATRPVDEAAQAKRQQAREQKVGEGISELLIWMQDIIRNGILPVPEKGYAFWEGMAKRMIDAQAPGLSGLIRNLGELNFFKEDWQSRFLESFCNIYLIAKAYQHKEALDPLVLQDVRHTIGFTLHQEALKEKPGVTDTWMVVSKQTTTEDQLTLERHWLYGTGTGQCALFLQFLVRGQGAAILLSPGMFIDAELVFYPSATPLRALVKNHVATLPRPVPLLESWKAVAQQETLICSSFPVRSERPFAVSALLPVQQGGNWWLQDQLGDSMALKEGFPGIWKLLALSGGHAMDMVVIGQEGRYEPVGVWHNQTYKVI